MDLPSAGGEERQLIGEDDDAPDQVLDVDGGIIGSQVAVGSRVVQIRADGYSTVLFVDGTSGPVRRKELVGVIPADRNLVALGRERELARLADAVATGETVQVYGEPGIGKTTLLLHAAGRGTLGADTAPRCEGAVLLSARGLPVEELLQELFLATYEVERMALPARAERRALLGALRVLVVVDDLDCSAQELSDVVDSLPHSTLVLASPRLNLVGRGCTVGLGGLALSAAMTMFRDALGRELTPEEASRAKQVWSRTDGHPGRLGLVSAFLRETVEHGLPPEIPPADGLELLIPKLLDRLSDGAAELLRALAAVGDVEWGEELAANVRPDGDENLRELTRSRLLVRAGARLRPSDGVREALADTASDTLTVTVDAVAAWLRQSTPADASAEVEAVTTLAGTAAGAGLHREVIRLVRAAAPRLMLGLRWRAWGQALDLGLVSARAAKSRDDEAYFTHESGVRAYCLGDVAKAAALLSAAGALGVRAGDALREALDQPQEAGGEATGDDAGSAAPDPADPISSGSVGGPGMPPPSGRSLPWLLKGKALLAAAAMVAGAAFTATAVGGNGEQPAANRPSAADLTGGGGAGGLGGSGDTTSSEGDRKGSSSDNTDRGDTSGEGNSGTTEGETDPWAGFPFGERRVKNGEIHAGGFRYLIDTANVVHGEDGWPHLIVPARVRNEITVDSPSRRLDRTPVLRQGGHTTESEASAETVAASDGTVHFTFRLYEGFRWKDAVLAFPAYTEEDTTLPLGDGGKLVAHKPGQVVVNETLRNDLMDVTVDGGQIRRDTSLWAPRGFPEKLGAGRASLMLRFKVTIKVKTYGVDGTDLYPNNFTLVQPDGREVRFDNAYGTSFHVTSHAEAARLPDQYIVTQVAPLTGTYTLMLDDYRMDDTGPIDMHAKITFEVRV
jgi:hypothetical protein